METKHLRLRELTPADADTVFSMTSRPEVARFMRFQKQESPSEAAALIAEYAAFIPGWLILERESDLPVGVFACKKGEMEGELSLSTFTAPEYWNKGYSTEVLSAMLPLLADKGARLLSAYVVSDNLGSCRVLEKCGFHKWKVLVFPDLPQGLAVYHRELFHTAPKRAAHGFSPVYDSKSRVLLLGTMPSPKSLENGFYYSHPRNRFWPVLSSLFEEEAPVSPEEKRAFLLRRHIALWDVLESCEIVGASDASIQNPVPNQVGTILHAAPIQAVFATGTKAAALYRRFCQTDTGVPILLLPSTSPANAAMDLPSLREAYRIVLPYLEEKSR